MIWAVSSTQYRTYGLGFLDRAESVAYIARLGLSDPALQGALVRGICPDAAQPSERLFVRFVRLSCRLHGCLRMCVRS